MTPNLRSKWLKLWGYKPYSITRVADSWDGEEPPLYGYYAEITMRKGLSFKKIKVKQDVASKLLEMLRAGNL